MSSKQQQNNWKDTGAVQKEGEEVQVAKKASEDRKEQGFQSLAAIISVKLILS
jgi:hypothetical protein